jgi:hypothetical protein
MFEKLLVVLKGSLVFLSHRSGSPSRTLDFGLSVLENSSVKQLPFSDPIFYISFSDQRKGGLDSLVKGAQVPTLFCPDPLW